MDPIAFRPDIGDGYPAELGTVSSLGFLEYLLGSGGALLVMAPGLAMMAIAAQALAHTTRIVLHPGVFPILLTLTMMTPE